MTRLILIISAVLIATNGLIASPIADEPGDSLSDSTSIADPIIKKPIDYNPKRIPRVRERNVDTLNAFYEPIKTPYPTGALLRSVILPGWGQLYNRSYIKAAIYGGLELYFADNIRKYWKRMDRHQINFQGSDDNVYKAQQFALYEDNRDQRNLYMWLTGITIFVSMFDAYVDAHMKGFDQKDKVFEVNVQPEPDRLALKLTYNF